MRNNGAMTYRAYAGIGSRRTPPVVMDYMGRMAARLAAEGFVLRSGAAEGADTAFERGAFGAGGACEVFLPWDGFGDRTEGLVLDYCPGQAEAYRIAAQHHPAWGSLKPGVRRLMARNVFQVLGPDCSSPSRFVLCWAPKVQRDAEGRVCDVDGGTGLAVRLAYARGIPVYHMGVREHAQRILRFCGAAA